MITKENSRFIKRYLENLKVNLICAEYTHCWREWHEIDYIPDFNKLYYILSGEGWIKIGNKEYYPRPGQLVLMPAGVKQSFSTISDNTYKKYWCHFTAKVGDLNLFDIIRLPNCIEVTDAPFLEKLFTGLIESFNSHDITSSLKVTSTLLQLICYYMENTVIEKIMIHDSPATEKLSQVVSYIENHLHEDLSIEELSGMVHLHPNYFIRFFKKHLGSSPIHYISNMRLEKAKNLLHSSSLSIKEIAGMTGFNDVFYFSRNFKQHTGFSPSEYRNAAQDGKRM